MTKNNSLLTGIYSGLTNTYSYLAQLNPTGVTLESINTARTDSKNYLNKLQKIANEKQKDVYAIYDNGLIIYDKRNSNIEALENVKLFSPKEK